MRKLSVSFKAKVAILVATLIWGISFCFMKSSLDEVPPNMILALRFTGASLLLAVIFFKRLKAINFQYIFKGGLLGLFLYLAYLFQTLGLEHTTPGNNAFLTAIYCVIVPFLYWIIKRRRPDIFNFLAAFICITGMGFISLTHSFTVGKGDILTIIGGFMFAVHLFFVSEFTKDKDAILLTLFQFIFSAIFSWIMFLFTETAPASISIDAISQRIFLSLGATGIALLLQNIGQKYTTPQTASILLSLESVFGALFSIILGYDQITLHKLVGFALIFFAVIVSETKLSFILPKRK
ncbi:MAG: DMT family transporter [Clostridia bacterium]|nr:DMT family transporter [Clostridia bacterium]